MAINLAEKYESLLDKRFTNKSLTEAFCGHDYDFDGVNTINVWTLNKADLHTYTKTGANRFTGGAAPTNVEDELNTYTLSKDISFAHVIEGYQNQDQKSIKKANAYMKQVNDEQIVPEIDHYRLERWAGGAGKTVINSTALTNQTVVRQILVGQAHLNNNYVPRDGRVCFVTETLAVETKLAEELGYNPSYTSKAIVNGEVARMGGLPIVAVPDGDMPAGVEFMIKYKKASVDPRKLNYLHAHMNPPGIYGALMEGLFRFDSFVLANKANGIYVYGTGGIAADVTIAVASGTATLTSSGATAIYYTVDGSNPKTSKTRALYSGSSKPSGLTAGTVVKAYAEKTGSINSGIAEHVVLASEA